MAKKPVQPRGKQTLKFILDGARKGLFKNSLKSLTISKISALSRVGEGSIYQYFMSKNEVMSDLAKELVTETGNSLLEYERLSDKTGLEESISDILDKMFDRFTEYGNHIRNLYKVAGHFKLLDIVILTRLKAVERISLKLTKDFNFQNENSKYASYIIVNSFIGVMHTCLLEKKPTLSVERLKAELKKMTLLYLKSF